jgi:hypothetical protein
MQIHVISCHSCHVSFDFSGNSVKCGERGGVGPMSSATASLSDRKQKGLLLNWPFHVIATSLCVRVRQSLHSHQTARPTLYYFLLISNYSASAANYCLNRPFFIFPCCCSFVAFCPEAAASRLRDLSFSLPTVSPFLQF